MNRPEIRAMWLLASLIVGGTAPAIRAAAAKGQLHAPCVDGSFGFSLAYPEGSDLEREKRFVAPSELEIIRFVHLQHTWSLAVRLVTGERPVAPEVMIEKTTAALSKELADLEVLRSERTTLDTREGALLAVRFKADDQEWLRQQAFIRAETTDYYVLIFLTPLADRPVAATTFDRIVASFRILRTEQMQQQIDAALQRGLALSGRIAEDPGRLRALPPHETFLRYLQDGKEIGFRHTFQAPRQVDHRPGVVVHERGWLFPENSSITQLEYDMFLSADLAYAKWDSRTRVFFPADPATKKRAVSLFGMESGLYKDGTLLVDYTPTFNAPELKEKGMVADPSFRPPAWFALLPQLMDLGTPEQYAFSAYDSDRRGLILRTYEVAGRRQVAIDGKRLEAVTLRDSEGFVPPVNEIDVDPAGRILHVRAGAIELIATTADDVRQRYKARVDAALEAFKDHPVRLPSLPDRDTQRPPKPPASQGAP